MSETKDSQQLAQSVTAGSGSGAKLGGVAIALIVIGAALSVWLFTSDGGKEDFGFAWLWGFGFVGWTSLPRRRLGMRRAGNLHNALPTN